MLQSNRSGILLPSSARGGVGLSKDFVVPDGLVGYWGFDLDCMSAAQAIDLVSGASTGDLQTGTTINYFPQVVDGIVGNALQFTAASASDGNSILTSDNVPAGFVGSEYTACAWIKTTATGSFALICNYIGGAMFSLHMGHGAAGKLQHWTSDGGPAQTASFTSNDGFWHHAAITSGERWGGPGWTNQTGRQISLYIDGVVNQTVLAGGLYSAGTVHKIGINRLGYYASNYRGTWVGDDLRVYNRELNGGEILDVYNAGLRGSRYPRSEQRIELPMLNPMEHFWQLYFSKNSGTYEPVTTTSIGVKSADASSDADETKILIPRL